MTPDSNVYFLPSGELRPRAEREALFREIEQREMMQRAEQRRADREASESPKHNQWSNYRQAAEKALENALPGDEAVAARRLERAQKEEAKRNAEIAEQARQADLQRHPLIAEARAYLAKHRETLGEERAIQIEAAILANMGDPDRAHSEAANLVLDGLKQRHQERVAAQRDAHAAVLQAQANEANASLAAIQTERDLTIQE